MDRALKTIDLTKETPFQLLDDGKTIMMYNHWSVEDAALHKFLSTVPPEYRMRIFTDNLGFSWTKAPENYMKYCKLTEGDKVIDAGACYGYHTKVFANLVGKTGHVFAFEPDFVALGMLYHNTWRFVNIDIYPMGLWSTTGIVPLTRYDNALGITTFFDTEGNWFPADVMSIDNFIDRHNRLRENKIEHIKLLKADVEGSEILMCHGAENSFHLIDNIAIAAYHKVIYKGKKMKSYKYLEPYLKKQNFDVSTEIGVDGEIIYGKNNAV